MKKRKLLQERFQQLAGIKPLYNLKEQIIAFDGTELPECIQDPEFMYYQAFVNNPGENISAATAIAVCESDNHTTADTFTTACCNEVLDIEVADLIAAEPDDEDEDEDVFTRPDAPEYDPADLSATDDDSEQPQGSIDPETATAGSLRPNTNLTPATSNRAGEPDEWWDELDARTKNKIMKNLKGKGK
jgi:hypothetical protein